MIPTLTDLNKGVPSNDISDDWMKASEDAQKLSVFYRKLANDQFNAYEKTMDRIMTNHNGHNARYRDSSTGRFVSRKDAAANDRIDRYEKTLDRIMNMHNGHDNAPDRMDAANENRIIHDYNPDVPQSMYRDIPKFVMKNEKPIERPEFISADDKRSELDVLKSINNDTTNILDTLHRITYSLDDMQDVGTLKARERELESGHGLNQENLNALLAGLSGSERNGKEGQEKPKGGFLDSVFGLGKDATWMLGLAATGMVGTLVSKVMGTESTVAPGGGYKTPGTSADAPNRHGGREPTRNQIDSTYKPGATPRTKAEIPLPEEMSEREKAIIRMISGQEGSVADIAYGMKKDGRSPYITPEEMYHGKHLSELTLSEVYAYQETLRRDVVSKGGPRTSAVGLGQFEEQTLKESAKRLNISDSSKFDSGTQARMILDLLANKRHLDLNNVDNWSDNQIRSLGKEWESLDSSKGKISNSKLQELLHEVASSDNTRNIPLRAIKNSDDREVVKALRNKKAGQQTKLANGEIAGVGSVTINLPPAHGPVIKETPKQISEDLKKRRPPPARSTWWDEWKNYFNL